MNIIIVEIARSINEITALNFLLNNKNLKIVIGQTIMLIINS